MTPSALTATLAPVTLRRSALYVPASNLRALDKARRLGADVLIFDLEDAVAPEVKATARAQLVTALAEGGYGRRLRVVRINALSGAEGRRDAAALLAARASGVAWDAVLLSKVEGPADLDLAAQLLPDTPLWAMMETVRAVLNAPAIAAHPALAGLVMGTNDLQRELGARLRPDRAPMLASLGACLLAARAHGRVILDGVFPQISDAEGFAAECEMGRDMGFDGKSVIHPNQIGPANTAFGPSAAELDLARRQIAAHQAVVAAGGGVAVVDGAIVENLHVVMAERLLAQAAAIEDVARGHGA